MSEIQKPTSEEIWNECLIQVHREDDTSWRHGSYVWEVYERESDNTFWGVSYLQSNGGETNELREGTAEITQVKPIEKTVIVYE